MKSTYQTSFSSRALALLELTERIVEAIPQRVPVASFRCHEVARIVGGLLDLQVQDGKYGAYHHSWCWTQPVSFEWEDGSKRFFHEQLRNVAILDPYAMGSLPPVRLIAIDGMLPHLFGLYTPGEARTDIDTELVDSIIHELSPLGEIWKRGI